MKIHELLKEDRILLDLEQSDKKHVLEEFVRALKMKRVISEDKVILEELLKREKLGSTGLENGIAVPHALIEGLEGPVLALAIVREGIDFEAVDQMPTYIILLLLGNKEKPGLQLKVLAHICRLVKETQFVEKAKAAGSSQDVRLILKEEEEKI
jgi:PTS system nitrogen regulatory IIA component